MSRLVILTSGEYSDFEIEGLVEIPDGLDLHAELERWKGSLDVSEEEVESFRIFRIAAAAPEWRDLISSDDGAHLRRVLLRRKLEAWRSHVRALPGVRAVPFEQLSRDCRP